MSDPRNDLARTTLAVMFLAGLAFSSFWILRPFLPAFVWGATIAVATWPLLERLQARLGGRRGPAVAVMTILMLLAFSAPLLILFTSPLPHSGHVATCGGELARTCTSEQPEWLAANNRLANACSCGAGGV